MSVVLYESKDQIATITINRPAKRNAISEEVSLGLRDACGVSAASDRVAILTRRGRRRLSGGADLLDPPKAFLAVRARPPGPARQADHRRAFGLVRRRRRRARDDGRHRSGDRVDEVPSTPRRRSVSSAA
jgi:enoyl-CoA hydratase/carnithine racemase